MTTRIIQSVLLIALIGAGSTCTPEPESESRGWSVRELRGAADLSTRMAGYYEPVEVEIAPAAADYQLPVDLGKLSNPRFARVYPGGPEGEAARQANALLAQNGFVVLGQPGQADVVKFYKTIQDRNLPIFVTSDALLHLYHIQFDDTLAGIETRAFFDDAVLISREIQEQALQVYVVSEGEIKQAARLLAAYATVPVVLLSQAELTAEAEAALEQLQAFQTQAEQLRVAGALQWENPELLEAVATESEGPAFLVSNPELLVAALKRYGAAHAGAADGPPLIPELVAGEVEAELARIERHKGFDPSAIFTYKEDYSQYVPRGHYTRSKRLQQYFKAFMWYGRMTFLLKGKTAESGGLVSGAEARRQTLAACMLAAMMEVTLDDGRTLAEVWDRLYAVTAYYVGLADDLTPYEYRHALRAAIGETVTAAELTDEGNFFEVRKALAQMRQPQIYSGLGDIAGPPVEIADEKTLAEALALTQGQRLMGQRYVPDSAMMGRLVYPTVGPFSGTGQPFTRTADLRGFPRGLDVLAVLGSDRAAEWLSRLGDDAYDNYDEARAKLVAEFAAVGAADWNRNMYWSWLHTLKGLLGEYGGGYPAFMRTEAWRDKQLSAALASWAQLRHDTILYAKQSYTLRATALPPQPRMVEGYVEPVPEFYGRLLALTRMTLTGLDDFGVLDEAARARLQSLEEIIGRLLEIAGRELRNERLSEDDYDFIRHFAGEIKHAVAELTEGMETTIVADVHTDANSGQVLEEGTGYLHPMVVVYPMPDGGLVAGVGPVLSHYEFKQPMSNRLTDEAWRALLDSEAAPDLPEWAASFTVSVTK